MTKWKKVFGAGGAVLVFGAVTALFNGPKPETKEKLSIVVEQAARETVDAVVSLPDSFIEQLKKSHCMVVGRYGFAVINFDEEEKVVCVGDEEKLTPQVYPKAKRSLL